ncbi:MAG: hypothetical protein PWQ45_114 [Thermosipho sp. (in: thermotogales)]|nr:hypothetical protein [Thermosipho sp. (in: thermotogales)]
MGSKSIFLGTTLKPFREFVSELVILGNHKRAFFPCAGRMTTLENLIINGYPANQIWASDISLYTSLLGYYFDKEKDPRDLGVKMKFKPRDDSDEEFIANAFLNLRIDQLGLHKPHEYIEYKHLIKNKNKHLDQIIEKLLSKSHMKGIHYDIVDFRDYMEMDFNEDDFLYANPPWYEGYRGGYDKMFPYKTITWNKPELSMIEVEDIKKAENFLTSKGTIVLNCRDEKDFPGFNRIFAVELGKGRVDYLVSNKKYESAVVAKNVNQPIKEFEIYNEQEITENSEVKIISVNEATGLYYRDLFVHNLGTVKSSYYYLMLIDNRVIASFALEMERVFRKESKYAFMVYGITKSSQKYKLLGKLFLLLLTSVDFKKLLYSTIKMGFAEVKGIKTSNISENPTQKTYRSAMIVIGREKRKDGKYLIKYISDFMDRNYKETLQLWLKKWGGK